LRAAGAAEAERMAKALGNELARLERTLVSKLWPLNAGSAIQAYWAYQAVGEEAKGREELKRCAARGVPMPLDP
jgi:hypothetical protein